EPNSGDIPVVTWTVHDRYLVDAATADCRAETRRDEGLPAVGAQCDDERIARRVDIAHPKITERIERRAGIAARGSSRSREAAHRPGCAPIRAVTSTFPGSAIPMRKQAVGIR